MSTTPPRPTKLKKYSTKSTSNHAFNSFLLQEFEQLTIDYDKKEKKYAELEKKYRELHVEFTEKIELLEKEKLHIKEKLEKAHKEILNREEEVYNIT